MAPRILALFLPLLLFQPIWAANNSEQTRTEDSYRIPVTTVTVKQGLIQNHTQVQGVIEAIHSPQIKTKISAEIVRVNVDEGDVVEAGQVLALLDDEGFQLDKEAVEADIQRLEALLENQRVTLKRDQSLVDKKLSSASRLGDSEAAVKQATAQLSHARALLKKANYQLSHTRVLAPIAGVIQQRSISKGDYVNPISPSGKPLFQIVDTQHLRARLYFPETLARKIKSNMEVKLKRGEESLDARIIHLRPMLEPENHSLHALAEFENTSQWLPGESITADVILEQHDNAIVIPEQALIRRPAGLVVFRVNDGKAEQVLVATGIRQEDQIEVISGINEGDQIVLDGAAYLGDKVAVEVQENTAQGDKE
jgi:RND family efflux transporter MFP subunit